MRKHNLLRMSPCNEAGQYEAVARHVRHEVVANIVALVHIAAINAHLEVYLVLMRLARLRASPVARTIDHSWFCVSVFKSTTDISFGILENMRLALSNGTGTYSPICISPLPVRSGDREEASCLEAPPRDEYTNMLATPSLFETAASTRSNLGRLRMPACTTGLNRQHNNVISWRLDQVEVGADVNADSLNAFGR